MMRIDCPYCGPRAQAEFSYERTLDSIVTLDMPPDEAVARLYGRENPRGLDDELWRHGFGCRQWLVLRRHRRSHEIVSVTAYRSGGASVSGPARIAGDDAATLRFSFDGVDYRARPGDTLAAALLANGVGLVARSFKYHRPRGIMAAGVEEPNALVTVGEGGRTEPNTRATDLFVYDGLVATSQNRWPNLGFDLGAVNGLAAPFLAAGFYYKTFFGPPSRWMLYEKLIRRAAGLGKAPTETDPDRYEHRAAFCDVLIVGGGPAGIAAAHEAAQAGGRVILVEQDRELGGSALREGAPLAVDIAALRSAGVRVLHADDGVGTMGPWLRDLDRTAGRAGPAARAGKARAKALACPRRPDRAGDGRFRTPADLRRQRQARRDAGTGRARLCPPFRRAARPPRGDRDQQ